MQFVKRLKKSLTVSVFTPSKLLFLVFGVQLFYSAIALISYRMAFSLDYHQQMLIHRTAMEAAPSCFSAGFIAALLGDLAHRSFIKKNNWVATVFFRHKMKRDQLFYPAAQE